MKFGDNWIKINKTVFGNYVIFSQCNHTSLLYFQKRTFQGHHTLTVNSLKVGTRSIRALIVSVCEPGKGWYLKKFWFEHQEGGWTSKVKFRNVTPELERRTSTPLRSLVKAVSEVNGKGFKTACDYSTQALSDFVSCNCKDII